jgi:predicted GH43/DUF377 family glycosyl hydrolase
MTMRGRIAIYYGAAASYTALVLRHVDELLAYMPENSETF